MYEAHEMKKDPAVNFENISLPEYNIYFDYSIEVTTSRGKSFKKLVYTGFPDLKRCQKYRLD